jgi:AraC-like DNA-binding protein
MSQSLNVVEDQWVGAIKQSLNDRADSQSLAREADYSVAQFYRRFKNQIGKSPIQLRRRLLLERAAFELTRTPASVSEIALRARFGSFEGFSRGFRRAFGVSPREFRKLGATDFRLEPDHRIHFGPSRVPEAQRQGVFNMNVLDRLIGSHYTSMKFVLDQCERLTEEQLDLPVEGYYDPLPWMDSVQSIRSLLKHIIGDGSPWPGVPPLRPHDTSTIAGLRSALEEAYPRTMALMADHEKEGLWDLTFVDSECDPPMVFSQGGWIGHVITFQTYRRIALMGALKKLGIDRLPYCDPIDFTGDPKTSIAPWSLATI